MGINKVLKTLVISIALGSGDPKLLTFPLWESKNALNAGNVNNVFNVFNFGV